PLLRRAPSSHPHPHLLRRPNQASAEEVSAVEGPGSLDQELVACTRRSKRRIEQDPDIKSFASATIDSHSDA
ncbi:hypothetical protein, partial [Mycobacterium simiae]